MIKKLLFLLILIGFVNSGNSQTIAKWKIEDVVKSFSAKNDTVYVVNFWATFCKPCIEEIPDFIRIVEQYKDQKVKLLLVSLDLPSYYPAKITSFAKKNKYNTNIVWLNETNADHFCPAIDKQWSGAIPSTIIVNNKTEYRKFVEDQMSAEEFEASIKEAIGGNAFHKYVAPMNDAEMIDNDSLYSASFATGLPKGGLTFKSKDSLVYAITEGKVSMVARIENFKVVIINNGNLYYTYSNLGSTLLKKGDAVKKDQLIGYATAELDGSIPTLEFFVNDSEKSLVLSKADFVPRKHKKTTDHYLDLLDSPKEPQ
ncbi:MAG: redoxin domain-containing protein [Ferruginibacter sp.]